MPIMRACGILLYYKYETDLAHSCVSTMLKYDLRLFRYELRCMTKLRH